MVVAAVIVSTSAIDGLESPVPEVSYYYVKCQTLHCVCSFLKKLKLSRVFVK